MSPEVPIPEPIAKSLSKLPVAERDAFLWWMRAVVDKVAEDTRAQTLAELRPSRGELGAPPRVPHVPGMKRLDQRVAE